MAHVWGFTIVNDVTARDRQRNHRQWFLGKALDRFCPMDPYVTTRDEVDPTAMRLRTWVNGELRQDANTGDLSGSIEGRNVCFCQMHAESRPSGFGPKRKLAGLISVPI
jgi:2-keto-4-pentenoate hydratase/2-oxohepta-3-ene-1,7-dioic acid hydratase in catechol pathway